MKLDRKDSAFTLIELLIVITIIGILVALIGPAAQGVLLQGQMTGTMSNARQLQIATQMMSLDTANSGEGISWTSTNSSSGGGANSQAVSLQTYFTALTTNNYLTVKDLRKILTAPGVAPGDSLNNFTKGNIAFNVFQVDEQSPNDQPFVVTANWQGRQLSPKASPYGNKGFVVFSKGGSGIVSRRATDASSTNLFPQSTGGNTGATYYTTTLN